MKTFIALVKRNVKIFFKDKGAFFSSLITPLILLVLYATFLAKIYRDSFVSSLKGYRVANSLIDGAVAGQLFSSLLAVCCVTVAFCSNMISVQDKVTGVANDLLVSPVKRSAAAVSYSVAAFYLYFDSNAHSHRRIAYIRCNGRLVYEFHRRIAGNFRRYFIVGFRNDSLFGNNGVPYVARTGSGCRNDSIRGVRLHLRSVYAHFAIRRRTSDRARLSARHLRNDAFKKPCVKRRIFGDELPARSNKRNKRRHRLQYLLFRQQSRNMGRVSGANRVDSSSYRFIYIDIRFKKT